MKTLSFTKEELIKLLETYYKDREGKIVRISINNKLDRTGLKIVGEYKAQERLEISGAKCTLDYEIELDEVKTILTTILSEMGYEVETIDEVVTEESDYYNRYSSGIPRKHSVYKRIDVKLSTIKKSKKM